jgi:hypothetical protein
MTILQKISQLNKKGITVTFAPSVDNVMTIIEVEEGSGKWQSYMVSSEMIDSTEEPIMHEILDSMVYKMYNNV